MPTILEKGKEKFTKTKPLLNVHREEILYREDIRTSFGYALTGITVSLAIAGVIYVAGKKLIA